MSEYGITYERLLLGVCAGHGEQFSELDDFSFLCPLQRFLLCTFCVDATHQVLKGLIILQCCWWLESWAHHGHLFWFSQSSLWFIFGVFVMWRVLGFSVGSSAWIDDETGFAGIATRLDWDDLVRDDLLSSIPVNYGAWLHYTLTNIIGCKLRLLDMGEVNFCISGKCSGLFAEAKWFFYLISEKIF